MISLIIIGLILYVYYLMIKERDDDDNWPDGAPTA